MIPLSFSFSLSSSSSYRHSIEPILCPDLVRELFRFGLEERKAIMSKRHLAGEQIGKTKPRQLKKGEKRRLERQVEHKGSNKFKCFRLLSFLIYSLQ